MRTRALLLAALVAGLAPATPSSAMGPQVVDKADDANYLNDNSPVTLPAEHQYNDNPTSVGSTAAADILTVEWKSLYDKRRALRGYTVTMKLKAPPTKPGVLYRATAVAEGCPTLWLQYHSTKPRSTPPGSLRHTCGGGDPVPGPESADVVSVPAKVAGNAIVWTVEFGRGAPAGFRKGTVIGELAAHTRDFVDNPACVNGDPTRCTTNPTQYDVTNKATATFAIGS